MAAEITEITQSKPVPELTDRELLEEIVTRLRDLDTEFRPMLDGFTRGGLSAYWKARRESREIRS